MKLVNKQPNTRTLPDVLCPLTDEEIIDRTRKAAELRQDIRTKTEEMKTETKKRKREIGELEFAAHCLDCAVTDGKERREAEVTLVPQNGGCIDLVSADGTVLETRHRSALEQQGVLL